MTDIPIRVLLVDDHAVVRSGLVITLEHNNKTRQSAAGITRDITRRCDFESTC